MSSTQTPDSRHRGTDDDVPRSHQAGAARCHARRRPRLPHGRGRRRLRRLLRRDRRDCSTSSAPSASATRRCRSRSSSAPASARPWHGMRPIVEIMTCNFSLLALDQIVNNAATLPAHVGWPVQRARRDPHDGRCRPAARRAALAQLRADLRPHPGHPGRRGGDHRGRLRADHRRAGGPRPCRHLRVPRACTASRASCPTQPAPVDLARRRDPSRRDRPHHGHLRRDPAQGAAGSRRSSPTTASTPRWSTCACLRPLDEADDPGLVGAHPPAAGRRGGLAHAAASAPRSQRGPPSAASGSSTRRSSASPGSRSPRRTPPIWRQRRSRRSTTIVAGARQLVGADG